MTMKNCSTNGSPSGRPEDRKGEIRAMTRTLVREEIVRALEALGYDDYKLIVIPYGTDRYVVRLDGERFGIWDSLKMTFVD